MDLEKVSTLIEQGKSEDLSRVQGNGICYRAMEDLCSDARDPDVFDNYCEDNCTACNKYVDRRAIE